MSNVDRYYEVDRAQVLSRQEFLRSYAGKRPVIISGGYAGEQPLFELTARRFSKLAATAHVMAKRGDIQNNVEERVSVQEFLKPHTGGAGTKKTSYDSSQLYIHDVSIMDLTRELQQALSQFHTRYLPKWYRKSGWTLLRFFLSEHDGMTPLHFDTLETHNLFFQIDGEKEFILVPGDFRHLCYLTDWRWSPIDATAPNYDNYPAFAHAPKYRVYLRRGEILYIPPRWLHQVRSLEPSISANIDWHTARSSVGSIAGLLRGAPMRNVRINLRYFIGLILRIPLPIVLHRAIISQGLEHEDRLELDGH